MEVYNTSYLDRIIEQKSLKLKKDIKKIGIINLMPNKTETEEQLLKLLYNSKENIDVEFIRLKNTNKNSFYYEYILKNYKTFDEIKENLDGIIITGAPLEKLEFEEVRYCEELMEILQYIKYNIKSSLYICWGAQFALNYYYGIRKNIETKKIFGIYKHEIIKKDILLENIKDGFSAPHSRYTSLILNDIEKNNNISILAKSYEGINHILKGSYNDYYILGHCEYDKNVLKDEYLRDLEKGIDIEVPKNYFKNDNLDNEINFNWEKDSITIYKNWIKQI